MWDLPVRLFHWLLAALVAVSFVTGKVGGNAMQFHAWSGYAILSLVLFRIAWGLVGGRHARFADFVRGPVAVLDYARSLLAGEPRKFLGHNPLGGWMVLALLASLGLQAATGLFANDDIMIEGPLAVHVAKETSDLLTRVHDVNQNVLLGLVGLHVAAALFYLLVRRENLIVPLIVGHKRVVGDTGPDEARASASPWRALVLVALCALAVAILVRF